MAHSLDSLPNIETIRALYLRGPAAHDFQHVLRVTRLAERIAAAEGASPEVVRLAALLHDVGLSEVRTEHHRRGAEIARGLLTGLPSEFVEAIAHAIEAHRFRTEPEPQTLEARVLSDADKLDAIGAIGVARAFAHAGADGTELWLLPWREIVEQGGDATDSPSELGHRYTPVHEFVYKLRLIPQRLYTASARELAAERLAFMIAFFDRLDEEALLGLR